MLAELRMDIAGERNVLKAAGTFGSRRLSSTEARYETAPNFATAVKVGGSPPWFTTIRGVLS
jgi:hypothetical protein